MAKAKGKAKASSAVKTTPLPSQAKLDFPLSIYEKKGRQEHAKLVKKHKKGAGELTPYEQHLLHKHFPSQEKQFAAEQARATAKRKTARKEASANRGLVETTDSLSDEVFVRKAPKVLL
jgi:hypothetical protein